jgi:hypothetical protein
MVDSPNKDTRKKMRGLRAIQDRMPDFYAIAPLLALTGGKSQEGVQLWKAASIVRFLKQSRERICPSASRFGRLQ